MFASDYPLLSHERCAREIAGLPFRDEDRRQEFSAGNADRLFFQAA
jgi:predicted TIM-barrel fold metal-dependent hydrolase